MSQLDTTRKTIHKEEGDTEVVGFDISGYEPQKHMFRQEAMKLVCKAAGHDHGVFVNRTYTEEELAKLNA